MHTWREVLHAQHPVMPTGFLRAEVQIGRGLRDVGAEFHLLPICHPELNPIEGGNNHSHHNYYHLNCYLKLNLFLQTIETVRKG